MDSKGGIKHQAFLLVILLIIIIFLVAAFYLGLGDILKEYFKGRLTIIEKG